jgi:hypothetical protein
MNRKDLVSLMEAYEDIILDKEAELSPEDEGIHGVEIGLGEEPTDEIDYSDDSSEEPTGESEADLDTLEDFEEEKNKMVEAHLHTIRSHAHEIHGCLERGALIEPWMEEKIAIANDYIVHVANAIMYKK